MEALSFWKRERESDSLDRHRGRCSRKVVKVQDKVEYFLDLTDVTVREGRRHGTSLELREREIHLVHCTLASEWQ